MKLSHKILSITMVVVALSFTSCKKEDVKLTNTVNKDMKSGEWIITLYHDSGNDETSDFSGFIFKFQDDGSLNAKSSTANYNGSWSVSDSNSDDDSPDDIHFNISFSLGNEFDDLTDDWHIKSNASGKLELEDISGGNGDTDLLTFEKK